MNKFSKLLFLLIVFSSTLITVSSYSWLGMWLGLEINLLSIIPLMNEKKNLMTAEASMKYFIVQAIASSIILMSIIIMTLKMNLFSFLEPMNYTLFLTSALLTKMGMAPFHFWFPEVLEGLSWINCLLILTWQKLAPMILILYNPSNMKFISISIIISVIISGLMALNQVSIRKIMAFSSINHMGWMMSMIMTMQTIWLIYFIIYSLITVNLIIIFEKTKCFFINQLSLINKNNMTKILFILNFLSLSGIPPFLGFIPKWLSIQILMEKNMFLLTTIMIMATLIMIFTYIRISLSSFILNLSELKWKMNWEWPMISINTLILNFWAISSMILITILLLI
uniref:NADH dehydrogenase subunit 2 n=1 Tax=Sinelater perroti TaxID=1028068 RepID=UPI002114E58F|nr:NADH dehydrogenase subunit 2 [Sinelater perroti]UTS56938.1 NADH dehydrogenase subunit 2 [Sinelater perroti]